MRHHRHVLAVVGCLSATLLLPVLHASPARAQCLFSAGNPGYGANGDTTALTTNGSVTVTTPAVYNTEYAVDVAVWVDDKLAAKANDIPALVLSYFEHANCIFAYGVNAATNKGVHKVSLRIHDNRIYYHKDLTPTRTYTDIKSGAKGQQGEWAQEYHQYWNTSIAAQGSGAPKVHLIFSAANFMEVDSVEDNGTIMGEGNGGASNGVGQGHAFVRVEPTQIRNGGTIPLIEDWWGDIAAHELGHAMGWGGHLAQLYDTMCCDETKVSYTTEPGTTPSTSFSMSTAVWDAITANNASTVDAYDDPYKSEKNPITQQIWDIPQVHGFLIPNNFAYAKIWRYTGTPCSGDSCPGWQPLDINLDVKQIAAADGNLYQLHNSGKIWRYTGTPCSGVTCNGWNMLDNNAATTSITAASGELHQMHTDGSIWRYKGTPCSGSTCNGWEKLDNNAKTRAIVGEANNLYQIHNDGAIWRYTYKPCTATACNGWEKLDNNGASSAIFAMSGALYQMHNDGSIWRWKGSPCSGSFCSSWQKLDNNANTKTLSVGGSGLDQLHYDGSIWRYTGTPCSGSTCNGWQQLDNNGATTSITTNSETVFQTHSDGSIWRYTGRPCSGTTCNGWQKLDNNPKTKTITTGAGLYQLHGE